MDIIAKNAKDTDIKYFGVEDGHCVNSHSDNTMNKNTHVCLRTVNVFFALSMLSYWLDGFSIIMNDQSISQVSGRFFCSILLCFTI